MDKYVLRRSIIVIGLVAAIFAIFISSSCNIMQDNGCESNTPYLCQNLGNNICKLHANECCVTGNTLCVINDVVTKCSSCLDGSGSEPSGSSESEGESESESEPCLSGEVECPYMTETKCCKPQASPPEKCQSFNGVCVTACDLDTLGLVACGNYCITKTVDDEECCTYGGTSKTIWNPGKQCCNPDTGPHTLGSPECTSGSESESDSESPLKCSGDCPCEEDCMCVDNKCVSCCVRSAIPGQPADQTCNGKDRTSCAGDIYCTTVGGPCWSIFD